MKDNNPKLGDNKMTNKVMHGWYSQQMRERTNNNNMFRKDGDRRSPASIYLSPTGEEVIVTAIHEANNLVDLRKNGLFVDFDDMLYMGEVTTHVRSLKE